MTVDSANSPLFTMFTTKACIFIIVYKVATGNYVDVANLLKLFNPAKAMYCDRNYGKKTLLLNFKYLMCFQYSECRELSFCTIINILSMWFLMCPLN